MHKHSDMLEFIRYLCFVSYKRTSNMLKQENTVLLET